MAIHQPNEMFIIFHILKQQSVCELVIFLTTNTTQKYIKYIHSDAITDKIHNARIINMFPYIQCVSKKTGLLRLI